MDWILDMLDAADVAVTIEPVTRQGDFYKHYPTSHLIPRRDPTKLTPGNAELVRVLEDNARAAGVDVRFRTPAVQLLRARSETGPSARGHGRRPARAHSRRPARAHSRRPARAHSRRPARAHGRRPARAHSRRPARARRSSASSLRPRQGLYSSMPARWCFAQGGMSMTPRC
jgi:hypothetical protein